MKKILCLVLVGLFVVSFSYAETVRVVQKPDNSIIIIHPAQKSKLPDETNDQWLDRVFTQAMVNDELVGLTYEDIDDSTLPADRSDRSFWEKELGSSITINQVKANKHKDNIKNKNKITKKARQMAIDSLKESGDLPVDYVE